MPDVQCGLLVITCAADAIAFDLLHQPFEEQQHLRRAKLFGLEAAAFAQQRMGTQAMHVPLNGRSDRNTSTK